MGSRHRFLVPNWVEQAERIQLPAPEAHHARVVRLAESEEIEVFDGRGKSCVARFAPPNRATIIEQLPDHLREPSVLVTLTIPPLKKDRFEWMIEKSTELGVARFLVFEAERTVANPSDRKRQRWEQTAIAATKQCGRTVVPEIAQADSLEAALAQDYDLRILLNESEQEKTLGQLLVGTESNIQLIIGPEGSLTDNELTQATNAGAKPASLGPRILRAETAAITAVATAMSTHPRSS